MKVRLGEVMSGSCFFQGKKLKKKVDDDRVLSVKNKKVSTRRVKGDPEVELTNCPLEMLGLGMPRHPETIVEIGDGNPLRNRRKVD
jgi:hypothetical protein